MIHISLGRCRSPPTGSPFHLASSPPLHPPALKHTGLLGPGLPASGHTPSQPARLWPCPSLRSITPSTTGSSPRGLHQSAGWRWGARRGCGQYEQPGTCFPAGRVSTVPAAPLPASTASALATAAAPASTQHMLSTPLTHHPPPARRCLSRLTWSATCRPSPAAGRRQQQQGGWRGWRGQREGLREVQGGGVQQLSQQALPHMRSRRPAVAAARPCLCPSGAVRWRPGCS